jgi:drug/metabolite transporter (DMT)-like permease
VADGEACILPRVIIGVAFGALAGLLWGLVFVTPLWLADYPAAWQSVGRYLAFGLLALPLAWWDRARLQQLTRADWIEATKLSLVGNLLYYLALSAAIQRAGAPLTALIIGTLPIVISAAANLRSAAHERIAWPRLVPALVLIATGLGFVNHSELARLSEEAAVAGAAVSGSAAGADGKATYVLGTMLAVAALVCWTIYPLRNARWLRANPQKSSMTWATAQGLVTLPLAGLGAMAVVAWSAMDGSGTPLPLGPRPWAFVLTCLMLGFLASWLGTWCWNEASQRLPATVSGPLIVFETIAAFVYAFIWRGQAPPWLTALGAALLIGGVVWALRSATRDTP